MVLMFGIGQCVQETGVARWAAGVFRRTGTLPCQAARDDLGGGRLASTCFCASQSASKSLFWCVPTKSVLRAIWRCGCLEYAQIGRPVLDCFGQHDRPEE
jgi:hypothetical protein